jgi:hypothetical protein
VDRLPVVQVELCGCELLVEGGFAQPLDHPALVLRGCLHRLRPELGQHGGEEVDQGHLGGDRDVHRSVAQYDV